jgi:hypothetical protein
VAAERFATLLDDARLGSSAAGKGLELLRLQKETTEVKGDFTRFLFDPLKRYVGVLVQQGG